MGRTHDSRSCYRTTNWPSYNAASKTWRSWTIWLAKRMQWFAAASGKRWRSPKFSDAPIQFCLTIKHLFGLALRQTISLVECLLHLSGLRWLFQTSAPPVVDSAACKSGCRSISPGKGLHWLVDGVVA